MCPHAGASGLFVLLVFSSKDLNTQSSRCHAFSANQSEPISDCGWGSYSNWPETYICG